MGWNLSANWATRLSLKILYIVFPPASSGVADSFSAVRAIESKKFAEARHDLYPS
jgi:hypothetical protein